MFQRLADELMAAYRREGEAMTKRENTIKMADANKAFLPLRVVTRASLAGWRGVGRTYSPVALSPCFRWNSQDAKPIYPQMNTDEHR